MRRRRTVLNLLNFTDHQIAGVGIFTKNLLRAWFQHGCETHKLTICQSGAIDVASVFSLPLIEGVSLRRIPVKNFVTRILYEQFILPFMLKGFDCYFSPTPSIPFALKLFNPGIKTVVTIHDMIPFYVPKKYGFLRTLYIKALSKYAAMVADSVITVSENSKKDICKISGIAPEKVHVVYNFMTIDFNSQNDSDERFFLTISTIEPGKNVEKTLNAFKKFIEIKKDVEYRLVWIGKIGWGYTWESLYELLHKLELNDKVVFTGYISEEAKISYVKKCSAIVYLSYYEGFGLAVLEGLFQNKPAIVSSISSLPEVVGSAGVTCNPDNIDEISRAMITVTENRRQFVEQIPEQLKKFDKDVQFERFLKIITGL